MFSKTLVTLLRQPNITIIMFIFVYKFSSSCREPFQTLSTSVPSWYSLFYMMLRQCEEVTTNNPSFLIWHIIQYLSCYCLFLAMAPTSNCKMKTDPSTD